MAEQRIEIIISTSQSTQAGRPEQGEHVRHSGAEYDESSGNWRVVLDPADPQRTASVLSWLFAAARSGAAVAVIDPVSGLPGDAIDPAEAAPEPAD